MNCTLQVHSVYPGASVQDSGRLGYQRFGIAEGGVMDHTALAQGAALLNNSRNDAVIEFTGAGGEFEVCGGALMMACTGAPMELQLEGRPLPWHSSFRISEGQRLIIGKARDAMYGYLHVSGGFQVPMLLGARSTHTRAGFGGLQGRFIQKGDRLPVNVSTECRNAELSIGVQQTPSQAIRFTWGAQAHLFTKEVQQQFVDTLFMMSAVRDRMGARLISNSNNGFAAADGLSGISDAVVAGDIQIGGDGSATVLLADRQPTGGYPRIATVISADLDRLAQLPVNAEFRLAPVSMQQAVEALSHYRRSLGNFDAMVKPLHRSVTEIEDLLGYNLIDGVVDGLNADD